MSTCPLGEIFHTYLLVSFLLSVANSTWNERKIFINYWRRWSILMFLFLSKKRVGYANRQSMVYYTNTCINAFSQFVYLRGLSIDKDFNEAKFYCFVMCHSFYIFKILLETYWLYIYPFMLPFAICKIIFTCYP